MVKTGGLFNKFTCERVTSNPGRKSRDGRLGSVLGKEEKGGGSGRHSDTGGKLHDRRRGGHRRVRLGAYGPRFEEPKTPGE